MERERKEESEGARSLSRALSQLYQWCVYTLPASLSPAGGAARGALRAGVNSLS